MPKRSKKTAAILEAIPEGIFVIKSPPTPTKDSIDAVILANLSADQIDETVKAAQIENPKVVSSGYFAQENSTSITVEFIAGETINCGDLVEVKAILSSFGGLKEPTVAKIVKKATVQPWNQKTSLSSATPRK